MAMISEAFDLAWRAMAFDLSVFRLVVENPASARASLLVLAVAALMLAFSQSMVLLANQVPPVRFALALLLGGVQHGVSALGYALAFVAAGILLGMPAAGIGGLVALVALAWAPNLLALIAVVPHFGLGFARLLEAWVASLVVVGLSAGLGVGLPGAMLLAVAGWLLGQLARMLAGPALARINWRLLEKATGRSLMPDVDPIAYLKSLAAERNGQAP